MIPAFIFTAKLYLLRIVLRSPGEHAIVFFTIFVVDLKLQD
jgi:hypothetical protein